MKIYADKINAWTYKKLQKLKNPLVRENIQRVPSQGVNYRQSVDLVLQQRWNCIIQTGEKQTGIKACSVNIAKNETNACTVTYLALGDMQTKGLKESWRYNSNEKKRKN